MSETTPKRMTAADYRDRIAELERQLLAERQYGEQLEADYEDLHREALRLQVQREADVQALTERLAAAQAVLDRTGPVLHALDALDAALVAARAPQGG